MGLRIRTNVSSLVAQRQFTATTTLMNKTMEKLASGARINRAADDAAGFAVSESLRSDLRSLSQSRRNAMDAVSLIEVAEGGLNEVGNILIRLKELAVQSASDNLGMKERSYLNEEFMQLKDEIDRIAYATEFNGQRLLVGRTPLSSELDKYNQGPPLEIQVDKNYYEYADALTQPNPVNIIRLNFSELNALTDGEGSLGIGGVRNPEGTSVDTKVHSQTSIATLDNALDKIAGYRSRLGALQNRLESTTRNLGVRIESLTAARSRIYDADFAEETATLTSATILNQAGASILSQANQFPKVALQLLQGN